MIDLFAFLGNPGKKYSKNRHNAAWLLEEKLSFRDELFWKARFKGKYSCLDGSSFSTAAEQTSRKIHFLKPGTYMNLSGVSVFKAASFFRIPNEKILVVHDELELPLGTLSLKFSGGLGGHNGLRSMKANFNTADFWRLRIGIGRPDNRAPGEGGHEGSGEGIVDWVLSDFDMEEIPLLEKSLDAAAGILSCLLRDKPEKFLPEWSKKKIVPAE